MVEDGPEEARVVPLAQPVEAHNGALKEITLRPPKGDDMIVCGFPFRIGVAQDAEGTDDVALDFGAGEVLIDLNAGSCAKYIARLGGLTPGTVKRLGAQDFMSCAMEVLNFFGVTRRGDRLILATEAASSSSATTTQPGPGASTPEPSSR